MARHYVQQMSPWFATLFSLHERSRDSPFNIFNILLSVVIFNIILLLLLVLLVADSNRLGVTLSR
jgi:IS4 transposase